MKKVIFLLLLAVLSYPALAQQQAPTFAIGNFMDDYGITYQITDSLWIQNPSSKYHILKWNPEKQYLVAKNDADNKTGGNKYTRIDYLLFSDMGDWKWGFCLTIYDAETPAIAEEMAAADRINPKKGCNGYPFSRMKKVNPKP